MTIMNGKVFIDGEEAQPIGGTKKKTKSKGGIRAFIKSLINLRS